ncbi:branched-chain amino acid transport system II carrier protein [Maribacter sp. 2-571]|uniref:branched-chain amino acid transport system II carrier protein n=1 Tax=Maribacter sp. 2-571 TaxID=3417569 RepID=UPI003D3594C6
MKTKKALFVTAFALFSLFFGAGNLILPPLLGFRSGNLWWLVAMGFCLSAVLVPICGILAHAKLQGTIYDFAKKVSPNFSWVYALLIYSISIALPSPRTAAVTHEIAIAPLFGTPPLATSVCYFVLVFIFVLNRSKILDGIGKVLTPTIILMLLALIGSTLLGQEYVFGLSSFENPFSEGILEGYQTFDAIGAVVVGGVIIISIDLKYPNAPYSEKKSLVRKAGLLAGFGLLLIYTGLIVTGALAHGAFEATVSRTALLNGISTQNLGSGANMILSILVSSACFTTAVGIVTGTADVAKHCFKGSQKAYVAATGIGCVLGIVMGQFDVSYIISVALPILMIIYPITIALIILNVLPDKYTSTTVFRGVIIVTGIFSIPDFMASIGLGEGILFLQHLIPLSSFGMAWVLPAVIAFVVMNFMSRPSTIKTGD